MCAFDGCTSLANVTISEGVREIRGYAFGNCTSLRSVVIPKNVYSIATSAFDGCTSLASVTISEGVRKINSHAFEDCTSLRSVVIPKSVYSIATSAFDVPGKQRIQDTLFIEDEETIVLINHLNKLLSNVIRERRLLGVLFLIAINFNPRSP